MGDIKHKVLEFINKRGQNLGLQSAASAVGEKAGSKHSEICVPIGRDNDAEAVRKMQLEPLADQDVLESIEEIYFSISNFDPVEYELKKLPEVLDCSLIENQRKVLQQQLEVVSNKVLQLILQKQVVCNEEFERVLEIQKELQTTLRVCREGRSYLNSAVRQFTTASLGILANYHKRQQVQNLLHSFNTIKTLHQTEERLQELLREGNCPGAISLLLECQSAAATYRQFTCVAALSGKLQDTLVMAEEQLDQALAQLCSHFRADHYSKVQAAYRLLGKTQMAMDQLHMHFASAIHNSAFNVVHGYVELCFVQSSGESQMVLNKKQFRELCKYITPESFIPCLIDLCKALWKIMQSYHQVINWHQVNDSAKLSADGVTEPVDFEASFNKEYVKQKLENGLARIWQDVQARISVYLLGSGRAWYKFEEFLQVLRVVHRLIEVGEEFCGSKSEDLQNSIRTQSINYFRNYHKGRLDEVRIFLENEGWEICPVKPSFSILQIQEFRSLRHILKGWKPHEQPTVQRSCISSPDCSSSNHSHDGSSVAGGYFAKYSDDATPFDIGCDDSQEEDILANLGDEPSGYFSDESDEDIPEELKKDFVDENASDAVISKGQKCTSKRTVNQEMMKAPILTNTALIILRQCGKYLQMSHLLRTIANEVITCMSQLFDYYFYVVHLFFANDLTVSFSTTYSLKLQTTLKRIHDNLIVSENDKAVEHSDLDSRKIFPPRVSIGVDLTQPETLYGLPKRVVAVESLIFLAKQFEFLHSYLEHLVPQGSAVNTPSLHHFNMQIVQVTMDVRQPVYMCVAGRAVDFNQIIIQMSKVNWEVKDVRSEHSQYVDNLLRELQIFSMRLDDIGRRIPLSQEVLNTLWESVAYLCCNMFVEGFSNAKKCSNGGRALMQLDFTQFLSKFEKLTSIKPVPNRELVELYVKAYYQHEAELEAWIKEHCEYSMKQLMALVNCACQNNKKARQRLTSLLEEMGR
ncbi:syndetin [Bacillus rossius redtenbacheri]|uniref:syndetin n=1 Tax=Bacillus rossius redtenbacheri TaxID=93214 RepID=UPI002FDD94A7